MGRGWHIIYSIILHFISHGNLGFVLSLALIHEQGSTFENTVALSAGTSLVAHCVSSSIVVGRNSQFRKRIDAFSTVGL